VSAAWCWNAEFPDVSEIHVEVIGEFPRRLAPSGAPSSPIRFAKQNDRARAQRRLRQAGGNPLYVECASRIEQGDANSAGDFPLAAIGNDRLEARLESGLFRGFALTRLYDAAQAPSSFASSLNSMIGAVQVRSLQT